MEYWSHTSAAATPFLLNKLDRLQNRLRCIVKNIFLLSAIRILTDVTLQARRFFCHDFHEKCSHVLHLVVSPV